MSANQRSRTTTDRGPPDVAAAGPRRLWFWVGGALGVLGVVAAIALIVSGVVGFFDEIDDFQRVPVGTEGRVTFLEAGDYTLYYEAPGADEAGFDIPPLDVEIAPADGRPLRLSDYDAEVTYANDGHEGRALYGFEVDDPGSYVVRSESRFDEEGEIAVGPGLGDRLAGPVVGGLFVGIWSVGGAAGIVLVTALRRRDARRRAAFTPPMVR